MTRGEAYLLIDEERHQQHLRWDKHHAWGFGDCSSPDVDQTVKACVLTEETGEVCRAILEADHEAVRRELVQVAAVCVAWLESF